MEKAMTDYRVLLVHRLDENPLEILGEGVVSSTRTEIGGNISEAISRHNKRHAINADGGLAWALGEHPHLIEVRRSLETDQKDSLMKRREVARHAQRTSEREP
jgi:hypothetical protein